MASDNIDVQSKEVIKCCQSHYGERCSCLVNVVNNIVTFPITAIIIIIIVLY